MDDDGYASDYCPLFMEKLPRNFETNRGLLALASLLEEEEEEEKEAASPLEGSLVVDECDMTTALSNPCKTLIDGGVVKRDHHQDCINVLRPIRIIQPGGGGGKVKRGNKSRHTRKDSPYSNKITTTTLKGVNKKTKFQRDNNSTGSSTLGEVQLFMKLWKVS